MVYNQVQASVCTSGKTHPAQQLHCQRPGVPRTNLDSLRLDLGGDVMFHTPAPQSRVQQGFSTHLLQTVFQLSFLPSRLSVPLSQSVPLPVLRLSLPVAHPHPCTDSLLFGLALVPLSGVCPSCAHLPVPSLSLISFTSPSVSVLSSLCHPALSYLPVLPSFLTF